MELSNIDKARLLRIHRNMIRRCYEYNNDYKNRGIKVCDEWLTPRIGTANFINWAINNGYKSNLSIDRIDNNGDYSPNNCRWSTAAEQQRNRRDNIKINGLVLIDYLKSIGREEDYDTIRYRISTMHWSIEDSINKPIVKRRINNG